MNPPAVVQYEKRALSTVAAVRLLDREAVDDRLELRAAADDGVLSAIGFLKSCDR